MSYSEVVTLVLQNTQYQVYPRVDTWGCRTLQIAGGKGPTRRLLASEKPKLTLVKSLRALMKSRIEQFIKIVI